MRHVPRGSNETSFSFSGIFVVSLAGSWKPRKVKRRQTALMAGGATVSARSVPSVLPHPSGVKHVGCD